MENPVKIGNVLLKHVPEGKTPEHLTWKKALEKEWAGEWGTLAKLTDYRYKMGLDVSFADELAKFKKGQLHWYERILCANGGIIFLHCEKKRLCKLFTTKATGEKVLAGVADARVGGTSDERLYFEIRFPLEHIHQVCELAGARRSRWLSEAQRAERAQRLAAHRFTGPGHASQKVQKSLDLQVSG
jgi:hypothetical protein